MSGPVGVVIRERALSWSGAQSQMRELAAGDRQAVADLPQALGLGQLTEEHGVLPRIGGPAVETSSGARFGGSG